MSNRGKMGFCRRDDEVKLTRQTSVDRSLSHVLEEDFLIARVETAVPVLLPVLSDDPWHQFVPNISPAVSLHRMPRSAEALAFAYSVKRAALGPHIEKRWGWVEALQSAIHAGRFEEKPFFQINQSTQSIGTLSFERCMNYVRFGEFYLLPEHHNKRVGSAVLAHCLAVADNLGLPVRLEHFHWNPVGSLYRRHGFVEIGRSESHVLMERPAVCDKRS